MHPRHLIRWIVRLAPSVALIASTSSAQSAQLTRLGRPDAEFPEGFTQIGSIRELAGNRVLVSDPRDKLVQLLDLAARRSTKVGRDGAGPGEYASPQRLFAFGRDSTLLQDPANGRFLLILPDGKPGPTRPEDFAPLQRVNRIRGVDRAGKFYLQMRVEQPPVQGGDEILVRYDPATKHVDTLERLSLPNGRVDGARTIGNGMLRLINTMPYAAEDVSAVAADGRAAVVRSTPYRVEWIAANGAKTLGPVVRYEPIRVTPAERRAFVERMVVPGQIIVSGPPGATGRALPRSGPSAFRPGAGDLDDTGMQWPTHMPPFVANAAMVAGDGMLWIQRTRAHDDLEPKYDIFDASGKLIKRVALPVKTRLVGFGSGTVYLARTDDDDLQYLQRYRL